MQLVRDLNDAIIPPLREFRAAVVENGMAFRVNIEQALRLHPRGNFASDVIIDLMVRRPLNELLPKTFLRWRLDGPGIEIGFLNKKPAARLEPARHFADNRTAFGKVM